MTEFTIVIESFNLTEGQGPSRWLTSLESARALARARGEVLIADVFGAPEFIAMLARDYPDVRRVDVTGMKYDEAKAIAAHVAFGEFVLFLDGDCVPQPGWLDAMLDDLRRHEDGGAAGYTRYDPGFYGSLMSVMDFGFFYPLESRPARCYASNNSGFRRRVLVEVPVPTGEMRCLCYFHACVLERRGTPMRLVPAARVTHETPAFLPERTRHGYDTIAAAWTDPSLPERSWLALGVLSVPLFYMRDVWLDWRRTITGYRALRLPQWQVAPALAMFPLMRLADVVGMLKALTSGPVKGGWGGTAFGARRVSTPQGAQGA